MRSLAIRLKEHNSGFGADSTREHTVRPWGLLAFVTGFAADIHYLRLFETIWETRRLSLFTQQHGDITTDQIVSEGTALMSHHSFSDLSLVMVVKGRILSRNI